MEKRAYLGRYASFNGTHSEPNAFSNPDDYLAFIDSHADELAADALRGYREHGRGIVLLQGPFGDSPAFVEAWFVTAQPDDFEGFDRPDVVREDCEEYDPEREIVVGVTEPAESFLWLWRMTLGWKMMPRAMMLPEAFEISQGSTLLEMPPQPRGDSYTPPTKRRFWDTPTRPRKRAKRRDGAAKARRSARRRATVTRLNSAGA